MEVPEGYIQTFPCPENACFKILSMVLAWQLFKNSGFYKMLPYIVKGGVSDVKLC